MKVAWLRLLLIPCFAAYVLADAQRENAPDRLKPHQTVSRGEPPKSPEVFDPDPNPLRLGLPISEGSLASRKTPSESSCQFNPDPGAWQRTPVERHDWERPFRLPSVFGTEPLPADKSLPRENVRRVELLYVEPEPQSGYGLDPLPAKLKLPRDNVRANDPLEINFHATEAHGARWRLRLKP